MSKRALVAAACFIAFLPFGAAAQSVGFGVKGGLALGDVPHFAEEIDVAGAKTELRIGYAAGGFLAIRFDNGFSIQPEVLYTQKGVKVDLGQGAVVADVRIKADYLDVPVLARYTFGKGLRGYVFAGPSLDFKLSAKQEMDFLGESEEEDISDEVEDFEFAVVFGGGIELGPLLLEARWSEGLTNLAKADGDESDEIPDLKSRTYLFLLGFRF
jgi:hypothetical protein